MTVVSLNGFCIRYGMRPVYRGSASVRGDDRTDVRRCYSVSPKCALFHSVYLRNGSLFTMTSVYHNFTCFEHCVSYRAMVNLDCLVTFDFAPFVLKIYIKCFQFKTRVNILIIRNFAVEFGTRLMCE